MTYQSNPYVRRFVRMALVTVCCAYVPGAAFAESPAEPKKEEAVKCEDELKEKLSPLQFEVTQRNGTERPFQNEFWNSKKAGIYVDIVGGKALFSSTDKFDSGTGWPSFTKPIVDDEVVEKRDVTHGMERVEVRSKSADSHLGHVFPDGPGPNGLRYCINSASLRFIPAESLEKEGYGQYKHLFPDLYPDAKR